MMCFHFKEKYTRHNRRIVTVYLLTQGVKGIDVHDFWCYDLKDRKHFWVFVVVGGGIIVLETVFILSIKII